MQSTRITLINPLGLHARAASKLVDVAKGFGSSVSVSLAEADNPVDGKSIMGLLMLGAPVGTELSLEVDGDDEQEAFAAVCGLINAGFHELDDP